MKMEKKYKVIREETTRSTHGESSIGVEYKHLLTRHAYTMMTSQLESVDSVTVLDECSVDTRGGIIHPSTTSCSCSFYISNRLPCKHMMAISKRNGGSVFLPSAVAERWTKVYNNPFNSSDAPSTPNICRTSRLSQRSLTYDQKYNNALTKLKTAATAMAEMGMSEFKENLQLVKQFVDNIVSKRNFLIVDVVTVPTATGNNNYLLSNKHT